MKITLINFFLIFPFRINKEMEGEMEGIKKHLLDIYPKIFKEIRINQVSESKNGIYYLHFGLKLNDLLIEEFNNSDIDKV